MAEQRRPKGRPGRYAKFEIFEASLPDQMTKRPLYFDGIGFFKGANGCTVWVKLKLPRGGMFKGRSIPPGGAVEMKLGKRASWPWPELIAERDRLQGLADRGEPLEEVTVPTFGKYADEWLERKKTQLRSFGVTKGNVNTALKPTFGSKALNAITVADLNKWIGKQSASLKPSSVQRQLNTFNSIMNSALSEGLINENPYAKAHRVKGIEERQRFITESEYKKILSTVDRIERKQEKEKDSKPHQLRGWLKPYIEWAYESGMRRAEILNLTWANIRTLEGQMAKVEVRNTKTSNPRYVTCTGKMEAILKTLAALDREEGDNRLFPVSMTTLKRALTRLWKQCGVEDVRLHDMRRTHATLLMEMNIDPRTVAGRLGHTGTGMLAKRYAVNRGDEFAAGLFGQRSAGKAESPAAEPGESAG